MNSAPDVVSSAFQMLMALGMVLGGLLVIFYFMKRYLKREGGGSNTQLIRVIASQYIGIKKKWSLKVYLTHHNGHESILFLARSSSLTLLKTSSRVSKVGHQPTA